MLQWYLSPARHFYLNWLWPYCVTSEPFDNQNSDIGILTPDPQIILVARRSELKAENQTLKAQLTMKNEENKTLAQQVEDMHSKKFLNSLYFYNNEPSRNKHFLILLSSLARNSQELRLKRIFEVL